MKCKKCGYENQDDAQFCLQCASFLKEIKPWYYVQSDQVFGPFTLDEMIVFYQRNEIQDDTLVWTLDMDERIALKQVPEFQNLRRSTSKQWILFFLIVLITVICCGSYYHYVSVQSYEKQLKELMQENTNDSEKIDSLNDQISSYKKQVQKLEKSNKTLSDEKKALETDKETLQAQIDALQTKLEQAQTYKAQTKYTANYDMVIRSSASSSASEKGKISKGDSVTFTKVAQNSEGQTWGQLSNGGWVCINDGTTTYLS